MTPSKASTEVGIVQELERIRLRAYDAWLLVDELRVEIRKAMNDLDKVIGNLKSEQGD